MSRRAATLLVGTVVVVLVLVGMAVLPVPYVVLGPGPAVNTLGVYQGKQVITITGVKTTVSKGKLDLTTVEVQSRIDLVTALRDWLDRRYAVVPREVVYPPGQSTRQVEQQDAAQFTASQQAAQTAALLQLGYPAQVFVAGFASGSPAAAVLRTGDQLTSVDGSPVTTRSRLVELISGHRPGQVVTVGYTRAGRPGQARIRTVASPDNASRAVIGVTVEQRQPHPFQIRFHVSQIGGPSAGLMFALAIVDLVQPTDLTGGKVIAGTGTIDEDGTVGPIGGIQQKLIGARERGATVFLTPAGNCAEALQSPPAGLALVKVSSLSDALAALRDLRSGVRPPACAR